MRTTALLALAAAGLAQASAAFAEAIARETEAEHLTVYLAPGEAKTIDISVPVGTGAHHITVGNPRALNTTLVRVDGRFQLALTPVKTGGTTVHVRGEDGNLVLKIDAVITKRDLEKLVAETNKLLAPLRGLRAEIVGARVVIQGEVATPGDYGRVVEIARLDANRGLVEYLVRLSPEYFDRLAERIESEIRTFAPLARARNADGFIVLEGTAPTSFAADRALRVATRLLPEVLPPNPLTKDPAAQILARPRIQNELMVSPRE